MFVRGGRSLGSTTFFPKAPLAELPEVLAAFVTQYYLERESPPEIIVEREFEGMRVLETTLAERRRAQGAHRLAGAGHSRPLARDDAQQCRPSAQDACLARSSIVSSLEELRDAFDLDEVAERHRMLRHQPHRRNRDGGLLRGVRRGGAAEERIPALQYRRASSRATTMPR